METSPRRVEEERREGAGSRWRRTERERTERLSFAPVSTLRLRRI